MSSLGQRFGKPPVQVIFVGLDKDTDRGRDVMRKLDGVIRAFYRAASMNAGESTGWAASRNVPGLGMTYQNNQGTERVIVRVTAPALRVLEQVPEEEVELKELPTHCVVDIVIPSSTTIKGDFALTAVIPEKYVGPVEFDSVGWQDVNEGLIFKYARDEPHDYDSTLTNRVSSLLVDMRKDPSLVIEFDIYGKVTPEEFPIVGYQPDTYSRTLLYDDNSLEQNPSMTPTVVIPTHSTLQRYRHITGGSGYHATQPPEAGPGSYSPTMSLWEYEDRQAYAHLEEFTDPTSGLVNKTITRAYTTETVSGPDTGVVCPVHGTPSQVLTERRVVYEFWAEWQINTIPGPPIYGDEYETTGDVVAAFYYREPQFLVGRTPHKDQRLAGEAVSWASIWTIGEELPTERKQIGIAQLTHTETPGNPGNFTYVGRLKIDRFAAKATFTPA